MKIRDLLSAEEIAQFTQRSNSRAWGIIVSDYLIITLSFVMMAIWPNPITVLLGLMLLGGRQLALSVIVHECGHRTFFNSAKLNDLAGRWLGGYLVFTDMKSYMDVHLQHHRGAGSLEDPDRGNYQDYPITRSRLRRKVWRDITGQTGWKRYQSIGRALANYKSLNAHQQGYLRGSVIANVLLFGVLAAFGQAWLYAIWALAFATTHMLIVRIRQIAEHAGVPDPLDKDPRANTRTVYTRWWENLLFAPHQLNYHLEHHLLASAPIYRLKSLHQRLKSKGYYTQTHFPTGYFQLIREVTSPG